MDTTHESCEDKYEAMARKINNLQAENEKVKDAMEYIDGKLYSITKPPNGFKRTDLLVDAKKAKYRAEQALKGQQ